MGDYYTLKKCKNWRIEIRITRTSREIAGKMVNKFQVKIEKLAQS